MGEPDVAGTAYRVGGSTTGHLPFLTALVVSARYDRQQRSPAQDGHRLHPARCWSATAPVAAGPGPGGGGRWRLRRSCEFLLHCCQSPWLEADCRRHQTCVKDAVLYVPARATVRRPGQIGRPRVVGRATAQSHGGARRRSRYCNGPPAVPAWFRRQLPAGSSSLRKRSAVVPRRASRAVPIRWVLVIRYLEERIRGHTMHCYAPTPSRGTDCGYCSGFCCAGRLEVTFEEAAGSPGRGNPAPVVGTSHRPNHAPR